MNICHCRWHGNCCCIILLLKLPVCIHKICSLYINKILKIISEDRLNLQSKDCGIVVLVVHEYSHPACPTVNNSYLWYICPMWPYFFIKISFKCYKIYIAQKLHLSQIRCAIRWHLVLLWLLDESLGLGYWWNKGRVPLKVYKMLASPQKLPMQRQSADSIPQ